MCKRNMKGNDADLIALGEHRVRIPYPWPIRSYWELRRLSGQPVNVRIQPLSIDAKQISKSIDGMLNISSRIPAKIIS